MSEEYFNKKMEMYEQYVNKAFDAEFKTKSKERAQFFMIDVTELSNEVETNPAVFDYIARLVAKATEMRNAIKIDVKACRAKRRLEIKDSVTTKVTVDDLSAMVDSDPEVLQYEGQYIFAQNMLDDYQSDKDASFQKHEMLKMLAADLKREKMLKSGM
jgi:hypothetical protein